MTIASLAMYPFDDLRLHWNKLWDGVRARLPFDAPALNWDLSADAAARRDDLLLGQTCGWPLVADLAGTVRVVGTFDCDVDGAINGTYHSLLVSNRDEPVADILRRPGLRVAANSVDSLSGWISLLSVANAHAVQLDAVEWTGAHAVSVVAVREGRADLAAIDSVSWTQLDQTGLSVVGRGPQIPCLPLVTAGSSTDSVVAELRRALAAAVSDPAMSESCASLRIRGFLDRELADYEGVSALAQVG
jgi:ABC-type phosphate/phosphonate transport system substrate-binding protein